MGLWEDKGYFERKRGKRGKNLDKEDFFHKEKKIIKSQVKYFLNLLKIILILKIVSVNFI